MKKIILYILLLFVVSNTYSQLPIQIRATPTQNTLHVPVIVSLYDADTDAFLTATGITDPVLSDALDILVLGLKADGLWSKGKLINPIAGGTASTHKYNLKDPMDLDAAYRLTFSGTVTHSSTGMTGNGSNGYANTYLNPNTVYSANGFMSIGIYSRTNTDGTYVDIGAISATNRYTQIYSNFGSTFYGQVNTNNSISENQPNTDSRGWYFASRNSSSGTGSCYTQKNLTEDVTDASTTAITNNNIYVMAQNANGSPSGYSPREIAFIWIGDALSTTEADLLYNRIQTYQTSLSRQF